jgi:Fic family protein
MLQLCSEISRLIGRCEGLKLLKPQPKLRKLNRVKTIQGSLAIEGNTLSLEQITAVLDGKRIVGPKREIIEAQNAISAYDVVSEYKPYSAKSFLHAHKTLMGDLIPDAGQWRSKNVGILQGTKVAHTAPQPKRVPELMHDLFAFLKTEDETHPLILSAIAHYEIEFIHPFTDGNGRIGRLWQTVMLSRHHPIFEFTPVESVIKERQPEYYEALGRADREGSSNTFIEFSLATINQALADLMAEARPAPLSAGDRLELAREKFRSIVFSRKDYMQLFKTISTATASRDLALAVSSKILRKQGDRRLTTYQFS